jgi:Leucine-rich repeat (LRR) protein
MVNLSGNRLESLPHLDGMPRLKKLYLNGNALREIPDSIAACATARFRGPALAAHTHRGAFTYHGRARCRCVKLEILEARQNQLATVPSGIGACRMLIELDLAQNQMVMLAPELAGCAKLTILDISGNGVTAPAIPPNLLKATSLAVRARTMLRHLGRP